MGKCSYIVNLMDDVLKKRLSEHLLWYFALSDSKVKKVSSITDEEWCYVERWVNLILDNYLLRLAKAYPTLTPTDLHICCLLRLKLSRFSIAELMGISSSSVSTYKMRIKKKINIPQMKVDLNDDPLVTYLSAF